jgi:RNA polymerase sigma-70 factor (ECF subfamily)
MINRLAKNILGSSADVPDVVQDVYLSMLHNLDQFRGDSRFSTWLTRIVINRCRSYERWQLLRRRTYQRWMDERQRQQQASTNGQPAVYEQVREAVRRLPMKYREAIVLRYFEGLAASEMSELLGVSTNTIEVRLTRARARLRQRLASYFLDAENIDERI